MKTVELEEYVEVAAEAARRAGAVLEQWRQKFTIQEKGRFDLVTDADLAAQRTIQDYLQERYADHDFLGEESGKVPGTVSGRPTWIVDPLDGTTNYVHDCPVYAVSIGLEINGDPLAGVIYDPTRQELFHGAIGLGAWLNDRRLQTSRADRLEQALLSTGFPPDLRGQEHTLDTWRYFSLRTQSLRRTGSTSLNLAYVAAGRHDGYWGHQIHPWDAAAAVVLIREAGGCVTRFDGSAYDLYQPDILASNGPLHAAMQAAFWPQRRD